MKCYQTTGSDFAMLCEQLDQQVLNVLSERCCNHLSNLDKADLN